MTDLVIKAAAVALTASVSALAIKKYAPDMSYIVGVIAALIITGAAISALSSLKEFSDRLIAESGISSAVFLPIVKCTVIAAIVRLVGSLSRDSGNAGTAASIEYLGAAAAICSALPLLESVLETVEELT